MKGTGSIFIARKDRKYPMRVYSERRDEKKASTSFSVETNCDSRRVIASLLGFRGAINS